MAPLGDAGRSPVRISHKSKQNAAPVWGLRFPGAVTRIRTEAFVPAARVLSGGMAPLAPGCAGTARGCRGGRGSFVSRIIRSPGDCRPRDSFGPSGETRTRGLLLPKQAPYQLGYTRSQKNLGLFPRCDTQLIIADSVPGGKRNKSACRTKAGPGGTGPPGPGACKIGAIMI